MPNSSVWAIPTVVTTPTVGRATAHSEAMWPRPRAPISTTTASVPSGALARVRGTPSSLLNDFGLAAVTSRRANTDASMSLVDVLPTDPVMPTTRSGSRSRAARPRAVRAAPVSATTIAVVPSTGVRDVR